jgi:hypothetical protein
MEADPEQRLHAARAARAVRALDRAAAFAHIKTVREAAAGMSEEQRAQALRDLETRMEAAFNALNALMAAANVSQVLKRTPLTAPWSRVQQLKFEAQVAYHGRLGGFKRAHAFLRRYLLGAGAWMPAVDVWEQARACEVLELWAEKQLQQLPPLETPPAAPSGVGDPHASEQHWLPHLERRVAQYAVELAQDPKHSAAVQAVDATVKQLRVQVEQLRVVLKASVKLRAARAALSLGDPRSPLERAVKEAAEFGLAAAVRMLEPGALEVRACGGGGGAALCARRVPRGCASSDANPHTALSLTALPALVTQTASDLIEEATKRDNKPDFDLPWGVSVDRALMADTGEVRVRTSGVHALAGPHYTARGSAGGPPARPTPGPGPC